LAEKAQTNRPDDGYPEYMTPDPWTPVPPSSDQLDPPAPPVEPEPEFHSPISKDRNIFQRIGGGIVAAVLALFKFGWLLLAGLGKASFLFSFVIAIGAYALLWGWRFGVGFALLLLVHEMGHVIQLRREGVKASAPIFIPFIGGRALSALHPALWFVGLFIVAVLAFHYENPFIFFILLMVAFEVYQRWERRNDPESRAYNAIPWAQRLIIFTTYMVLVVALVWGMHAAYVQHT
jgi:hypothetical protein